MNKGKLQNFYETVYRESSFGEFDDYERNRLLRKIYLKTDKNCKLLDIAAGDGLTSSFFSSLGYQVKAIEWNSCFIEKLKQKKISAIQHDVESLPYPFPDNSFDEIFWGDNIEHLFFPLDVAKELFRILRPGGRIVITTPNHGWLVNRLYYFIFGIPRRTEGQKLPIWEWQHIRYFNKNELCAFLAKAGFKQKPVIFGTDRRKIFEKLSEFIPSLFGSLLVAIVRKE